MTYSYTQISQYLTCPRRYRHRYLDGWKEKDTRAAMLFGRAFEHALGAFFRREDSQQPCSASGLYGQKPGLHYSNGTTWDRMLRQGHAVARLCQDDRVRVVQPRRDLQIKFTRPVAPTNDFVSYVDGLGKLDGKGCLFEWKTRMEPVCGRTGRPVGFWIPNCLLLLDHRHLGGRSDRVRSQAAGRGSVPAHHHHRRAAA